MDGKNGHKRYEGRVKMRAIEYLIFLMLEHIGYSQ